MRRKKEKSGGNGKVEEEKGKSEIRTIASRESSDDCDRIKMKAGETRNRCAKTSERILKLHLIINMYTRRDKIKKKKHFLCDGERKRARQVID